MARDPADVLAERRFDDRFGTGEWQHTRGAVGGADQREPWLKAARRDLAALDEAGYEVRPKAEAVPVTDGDDPDQPDHRGEPEGDPSP